MPAAVFCGKSCRRYDHSDGSVSRKFHIALRGGRMAFVLGNLRPIFVGSAGLRSGWRIGLWLLAVIAVGFVAGIVIFDVVGYRPPPEMSFAETTVANTLFGVLVAIATFGCAWLVDKRGIG